VGTFTIPTISDFIGRRVAVILSLGLAAIFLYFFIHVPAGKLPELFVVLFFAALFNNGAMGIITGPLPAEAAPVGLIASVAGLVIGTGEIFGGGVAPVIAGAIAKNYGLQYTLVFALCGELVGVVLSLFLRETAPRKRKSTKSGEVSSLDELEEAHPEGITSGSS
jgi:MFS family permease